MKLFLLCVLFSLVGCLSRPTVERGDIPTHLLQNTHIETSVLKTAKTGDWLVIRGYHATDNLVSNVTGVPLSHVGVFNLELSEVIEAEAQGVHISSLSEFIDKSYRLLIIRPRWQTEDNGWHAYQNGAALVGKKYDFLGTVGFNYPTRYYCSELAVLIYKPWQNDREKFPRVITPGELYLYGEVLYDSLPRNEINSKELTGGIVDGSSVDVGQTDM